MHSKLRLVLGLVLGIGVASLDARAESTIPPPGLRHHTPRVHALINARIVSAPGKVIEQGTVVLRDGNIVAVGAKVNIPPDARVWDLTGKTIYAGFIDLYTDLGLDKKKKKDEGGSGENKNGKTEIAGSPYWNSKILPQVDGAVKFKPNADAAKALRGQGIGLVLTLPPGDIMGGTGALVTTGDGRINELLISSDVVLGINFESPGWGDDNYPNSLMGVCALLRQSFLDADWHTRVTRAWEKDHSFDRPEVNDALVRLAELKSSGITLLMYAEDEKAFLRASGLATEFGLPAIMRGSNYEYRTLDKIKATGHSVLLPLDFPDDPAVKSADAALQVDLEELRHWYFAPENASRLHAAGIPISFTTSGLEKKKDFLAAVRKTVKRGLSADAALAALTTAPARMVGQSRRYGMVAKGFAAQLVVTDGDLFDKETKIVETWVDGDRYVVTAETEIDVRGTWDVTLSEGQGASDTVTLVLKKEVASPEGTLTRGQEADVENLDLSGAMFSFSFNGDSLGMPGVVRMSGIVSDDQMLGHGTWSDGGRFSWSARRTAAWEAEPDTTEKTEPEWLNLTPRYPEGAFGNEGIPAQADVIAFTGATIWTSGAQGIVENATLLVARGKIIGVGKNLKIPGNAVVVDATGMHITPGLVDCHSHSAIEGGVNEGTQTITAEVRIGDVVDPTDIGIYRELAGGLTTANLLHGSANAIGGQNQVIKLRWGGTAEDFKFEGAKPGIKFALGENPKQSNWGDDRTSRYPQTRMGVEQIIRDGMQAATDYMARWDQYNKTKKGMPPRRDLELEAISEIIRGERLVHSHSYRQDEILMLTRIAEDYGFIIGTFQHVLEGYKVADRLAEHGAGASTFSDWWAYKFEVYDAIPYNAALMYEQNVVVSINSDSGELARRMNTEAAKAVKYGGVPPAEALKFVTLNPAKQLRIDHRVGSLETGKDADFAVWNGSPLSTLTMCTQTWIDGRKYFDREDDLAQRAQVQKERAELIQYVLKNGDGKKSKNGKKKKTHGSDYSCTGAIQEGGGHEHR